MRGSTRIQSRPQTFLLKSVRLSLHPTTINDFAKQDNSRIQQTASVKFLPITSELNTFNTFEVMNNQKKNACLLLRTLQHTDELKLFFYFGHGFRRHPWIGTRAENTYLNSDDFPELVHSDGSPENLAPCLRTIGRKIDSILRLTKSTKKIYANGIDPAAVRL